MAPPLGDGVECRGKLSIPGAGGCLCRRQLLSPSAKPFQCTQQSLYGLGNPFGLAGNKYGWMVELDPANPNDPGTKHTALGRFRHEAVAIRADAGKPLEVYSGCDRRGGHIYKFVSNGLVQNPKDPANSELFHAGVLHGAVFNPNGSGEWRPLLPTTAVAPIAAPVLVPHANRKQGGAQLLKQSSEISAYSNQYRNLGDLYSELGAILIDAHLAANAAGITGTARPEDTDIDPRNGDLLIAFTSGLPGDEGVPDQSIFKGPKGQTPGMAVGLCGCGKAVAANSNGAWWQLAAHPKRGVLALPIPTTLPSIPAVPFGWLPTSAPKSKTTTAAVVNMATMPAGYCPLAAAKRARLFALRSARWNRNSPVRAPALMAAAFYSPCSIQAN